MRKHAYSCTNCGSDIHARSTCPLLPCRVCNENGHTSTTCPTKLEGRKTSKRIAERRENLSLERIERNNSRHRVKNMNEYQGTF